MYRNNNDAIDNQFAIDKLRNELLNNLYWITDQSVCIGTDIFR